LDAVLADIAGRSPDRIVCLGDLVGYGAFPNEVIDTIRAAGIPTLTGNYDDGVGFDRDQCGCAYTEPADIKRGDRSLRWTQSTVTHENKAWLRGLLGELRFEFAGKRVLCVHGSPRRINEYLFADRPERSLLRMFEGLKTDLVLCGHTHTPYHRRLGAPGAPASRRPGGLAIELVNTGAVGRPRDGDPRACYAVIDVGQDVQVEFPRVAYDFEAAAKAIEATDLPGEFAQTLRTGRY
jgi:diadenosine tetraphosphatase ApaH/serine/threonine PP2A family protein phosphatase